MVCLCLKLESSGVLPKYDKTKLIPFQIPWNQDSFEYMIYLSLPVPCISESCIKIKIKLNFYFDTSLWCLKRFLPFEAPQRSVKIKIEVSDYAPVMSTFICIKTLKSMFKHIDNTFSNTLIIPKILQIIVFRSF